MKRLGQGWAISVAVATLAVLAPRQASAGVDIFFDESVGRVDSGEFKIGLWSLDYGLPVLPRTQIGTATLPYVGYAFGATTANLHVKHEPWRRDRWRTSVSAALTYLRYQSANNNTTHVGIIPVRAMASYDVGRFRLLGGIGANISTATTEVDVVGGGLVGTNVQVPLGVELRVASWFHMALRRTFIPYQALSGSAEVSIDQQTTAMVYAKHQLGDIFTKAYTSFDLMFGGRRVGARLGVSWGNIELPVVPIIIPVELFAPRGDLFIRF